MSEDLKPIADMCVGCRYSTIASGTEFVCNREGMTREKIAEQAMNVFFGEECKCYEPMKI